MDDLIITHKLDLESFHNHQLFNELTWITFLPTFERNAKYQQNASAKTLATKVKTTLALFYLSIMALAVQLLIF